MRHVSGVISPIPLYTQILCHYGGFPIDVFPSVTQGHQMRGQSIYILHLYIYGESLASITRFTLLMADRILYQIDAMMRQVNMEAYCRALRKNITINMLINRYQPAANCILREQNTQLIIMSRIEKHLNLFKISILFFSKCYTKINYIILYYKNKENRLCVLHSFLKIRITFFG